MAESTALDQARKLLEERLVELEDEKRRVERALAEVTGGRSGRRGPGRPKGSTNKRPSRRRQSSGGTRAEQALSLIRETPGIRGGEIAKRMGIAPNYVYRLLGELTKDGLIFKQGRTYTAVEGAGPNGSAGVESTAEDPQETEPATIVPPPA